MRNIRDLVKELLGERPREYDAFSHIDNNFNELLERVKKLEARNLQYYCRAWRDENLSVPSGTFTNVPLNVNLYPQLGNMHDTVNNNDSFFIRRDGVYAISGAARFVNNGTGYRFLLIALVRAGTTYYIATDKQLGHPAVPGNYLSVTTNMFLFKDDVINLVLFQDSGVALNSPSSGGAPHQNFPILAVMERREDLPAELLGLLNPDELTS